MLIREVGEMFHNIIINLHLLESASREVPLRTVALVFLPSLGRQEAQRGLGSQECPSPQTEKGFDKHFLRKVG